MNVEYGYGCRALFLVALAALGVNGVAAEATPAASEVPTPNLCRVPSRDTLALAGLTGTPTTGEPLPAGQRARRGDPPPGAPADPATSAAIAATVRELAACANAGDQARALALYSDNYFRRLFAAGGQLSQDYGAFLATPRPVSADKWIAVPAVSDVRLLADGRVGAFVAVGTEHASDPPFFIFARVNDRWLIDEIVEPAS